MRKGVSWKVLIFSFILVFAVAFTGSLFTSGNVKSQWYLDNKPSFTPPNWIFAPVWTLLYVLISLSLYFVWTKAKKTEKGKIAIVFGINLLANVLWSYLFFEIKNPLLAFLDIILILTTIILMIFTVGKIDKKAGWLLVPYLLWVIFASFLNFGFLL